VATLVLGAWLDAKIEYQEEENAPHPQLQSLIAGAVSASLDGASGQQHGLPPPGIVQNACQNQRI
jgi:hypothetical protein